MFGYDSRVRISLSDDFGETFKYILKESAPNTGSCQVILPHVAIGQVNYAGTGIMPRAGIIVTAFRKTHLQRPSSGISLDIGHRRQFTIRNGDIALGNRSGQLCRNGYYAEGRGDNDRGDRIYSV